MQSNTAVIIVIYKTPKDMLTRLQKSLVMNGILPKNILTIDNEIENRGYGKAINELIKKNKKKYTYFFIINPDVVLLKDSIKRMFSVLEKNSLIGIVGPKILDGRNTIWSVGGVLDPWRYSGGLRGLGQKNKKYKEAYFPVDFVSGTALLVKKEVFEKIGYFAEDYFLYYEDVDFCVRARKAGFTCVVAPQAEIIHYASSSTGKNSPLMQYYMARNHCLFVERFAPLQVKLYEIARLPKTLWQARKKKYELLGIRDYFLRRFNRHDYWS